MLKDNTIVKDLLKVMALISVKKAKLQNNRDPFTIFILSQWLSKTHDNTLHLLHHANTEGRET